MNTKWRVVYLGTAVPALVIGLGLWSPLKEAVAHSRAKAPAFKVDPFWPKALPIDRETNPLATGYRATGPGASKPWVTGEVAGTCIDSKDHLITVNRGPAGNLVSPETVVAHPSPSVVEYDAEGNVVNAWPPNIPFVTTPFPAGYAGWRDRTDPPGCDGSPACHAATRGVPTGIHGCFVDYQDNIWILGNGDGIAQKYTHDGSTLLLQIGRHNVCDNPPANACGNSGANPLANKSHTLLNQPPDLTVDPDPDPVTGDRGSIYIADGYGNHRVVVFNAKGQWLRHWGGVVENPLNPNATPHDRGSFGAGDGGHPHCIVLGEDKLLYVCDRQSDRVLVYSRNPTNCAPDKNGDNICQPLKIITVIPGTGVTASGRMAIRRYPSARLARLGTSSSPSTGNRRSCSRRAAAKRSSGPTTGSWRSPTSRHPARRWSAVPGRATSWRDSGCRGTTPATSLSSTPWPPTPRGTCTSARPSTAAACRSSGRRQTWRT